VTDTDDNPLLKALDDIDADRPVTWHAPKWRVPVLIRGSEELMTALEVAEELGVCRETVYRWVRRGLVPVERLPAGGLRFRLEDVLSARRSG